MYCDFNLYNYHSFTVTNMHVYLSWQCDNLIPVIYSIVPNYFQSLLIKFGDNKNCLVW